jgi:hypothetical protein
LRKMKAKKFWEQVESPSQNSSLPDEANSSPIASLTITL